MNSRSLSMSGKKSLVGSSSPETIHLMVLSAVGFAVVLPMIFWGVPSALDLSNHFRFALPFYDAIRTGHFYPGWLAESNGGFGDASFRFYPPALYYLLAGARALSGSWYAAMVATFGVLSMLGALGMYFWAREFTSSQNAMWAGVFYAVAPYHLNQLYQALLLAEFAGAAVLPFAFLFVERVCRQRRARDVAGLAATYALLMLTHLPLAVIGSIALLVYGLLRIERTRILRTVFALGMSVAIGLAASACYWVTMISELRWIRADNVNPEPGLDYRYNFVLSTFSPDSVNVWWMNILLLASLFMFWPAALLVARATRGKFGDMNNAKPIAGTILAFASVLALSLFMATPLSRPVWNMVRPLQETQLPWRWLAISSMMCSLLLAFAIPMWTRLIKTRKRPIVILALGTIAIAFAFSVGHTVREARWLTPSQFEQTLRDIPGSASVYQWLPVWVRDPRPEMKTPVVAGDRGIRIESWTPEKRIFHVSAGQVNEARVRTFYYPHWAATFGDQKLAIRPDETGAMLVTLPSNEADITLEFREPVRVKYAAGSTLFGWALIGGLFWRRRSARYSHPS